MKKILLVLTIATFAFGCKKREVKMESVQKLVAAENDCSFFDSLPLLDTENQVKWLRENQVQACDSVYDGCRIDAHTISSEEYTAAISNYWGTDSVRYSKISLGDIHKLCKETKYEKFIKCAPDSQDEIILTAVTNFTKDPACYSVPLFYSIPRRYNLSDSSVVIFTRAKKDGMNTIVFYIDGTTHYYDMAGYPL